MDLFHFIKQVPQLLALGFQIVSILLIGWNLNRHLLDDAQAVAIQANDFFRVVGEEADLPDAQIQQDLGTDSIMAKVRSEAQTLIGLNRVQILLLLELVSLQLGQESDAAALLAHVEND